MPRLLKLLHFPALYLGHSLSKCRFSLHLYLGLINSPFEVNLRNQGPCFLGIQEISGTCNWSALSSEYPEMQASGHAHSQAGGQRGGVPQGRLTAASHRPRLRDLTYPNLVDI